VRAAETEPPRRLTHHWAKRRTIRPTPKGTEDQLLRQPRPPRLPAQMRHKWRQGQRLRRRKAWRPTLRLPKGNTPPHSAHKLRTRALQPPRLVLLIRVRSRRVLPNDRRCSIISKSKRARMPSGLKQRRPIEPADPGSGCGRCHPKHRQTSCGRRARKARGQIRDGVGPACEDGRFLSRGGREGY
jgi:hypothetical protein